MMGLSLPARWELPRLRVSVAVTIAAGTVLLAGAIHIIVILLVPYHAKDDGWSRLEPHAGEDRFLELPADVPGLDPLFVNGACRLNLAEAPAGITVDARDRFWSVALIDPRGTIVFSLNDRTAVDGQLDMNVVNAAQNVQLRESPTLELELTIVAESPSDDLIAVLRLYAPTRVGQEDARRVLARSECLPAPFVIPAEASG